MSDPAIRVEHLSKKYRLGQLHTDLLSEQMSYLLRLRSKPSNREAQGDFWALRDLTFDVAEGEVLGIIGRNGAGKSTLLKILSRLTAPTEGRARIRGRLASLLEVGTGFHPELTGRENIYLNGTILGMRRREIDRKFDEIVAFSGVETFLDTPVKRYSSGMYVRLAFAVAAHVESEILVVDEVLAVGDAEFQKRCLGKMGEVAKGGRTVLFVSHNMDAISRICTEGLYLRDGQLAVKTGIGAAIEAYVSTAGESTDDLSTHRGRWGSGDVRITHFELRSMEGAAVETLSSGSDYDLVMSYSVTGSGERDGAIASISFADARGVTALLVSSDFSHQLLHLSGSGVITCRLKDLNIVAGTYSVTLYLGNRSGDTFDCLNDVRKVEVIGGDFFGTGHPGYPEQCKVLTRSTWSVA